MTYTGPPTVAGLLEALRDAYDAYHDEWRESHDAYDMGRMDAYDDAHTLTEEWAEVYAQEHP